MHHAFCDWLLEMASIFNFMDTSIGPFFSDPNIYELPKMTTPRFDLGEKVAKEYA